MPFLGITKLPPSPQIIISLRHGSLREVFCSDPTAAVFVVAWDFETADSAAVSISQGHDTLYAHVQRAVVQPLHHLIGSDIEAALAAAESASPSDSPPVSSPGMSLRERATVVAALRWWQESVLQDSTLPERFPQLIGLHALSLDEGNCLCNRLTTLPEPCQCELPGPFRSGVPGIVAAVANGRLVPGAKVERCDVCRRFATDELAYQHLVDLQRV